MNHNDLLYRFAGAAERSHIAFVAANRAQREVDRLREAFEKLPPTDEHVGTLLVPSAQPGRLLVVTVSVSDAGDVDLEYQGEARVVPPKGVEVHD